MVSIIIPAHNEERVIGRCLAGLVPGLDDGFEIVVACNGCDDRTADVARGVDSRVRVLETKTASKIAALNMGDEAASCFPRVYLDADVRLSTDDVRRLVGTLAGGSCAASPLPRMDFAGTGWAVRAFYNVWLNLPYVREGLCGVGVYALSERGRGRFRRFPDVINDDGFVRSLFAADERPVAPGAHSVVAAPRTLRDLVRIMTRSRLGIMQLKDRYGGRMRAERQSKSYLGAAVALARRPGRWAGSLVYLYVNLVTRARARRQWATIGSYVWERDETARRAASATA